MEVFLVLFWGRRRCRVGFVLYAKRLNPASATGWLRHVNDGIGICVKMNCSAFALINWIIGTFCNVLGLFPYCCQSRLSGNGICIAGTRLKPRGHVCHFTMNKSLHLRSFRFVISANYARS